MASGNFPGKVYHGTDAASAENIRQEGLNEDLWRNAGGGCGVDNKGFSVTAGRATAEKWALFRALERGGPAAGVVLEADASQLPLQTSSPGQWTDPDEFFIAPEDFPKALPGVFR